MAVAIYIKYELSLNCHLITTYSCTCVNEIIMFLQCEMENNLTT